MLMGGNIFFWRKDNFTAHSLHGLAYIVLAHGPIIQRNINKGQLLGCRSASSKQAGYTDCNSK